MSLQVGWKFWRDGARISWTAKYAVRRQTVSKLRLKSGILMTNHFYIIHIFTLKLRPADVGQQVAETLQDESSSESSCVITSASGAPLTPLPVPTPSPLLPDNQLGLSPPPSSPSPVTWCYRLDFFIVIAIPIAYIEKIILTKAHSVPGGFHDPDADPALEVFEAQAP